MEDKQKVRTAPANLPVNYRQLFCFAYKTNFLLILKTSLFVALFALPFIASVVFKGLMESAIGADTSVEEAVVRARIMMFRGIYGFVIVFCFLILSIALSGAFNVMKKLLQNDGVQFRRDFWGGIKKNWGAFVLISSFYGLILGSLNMVLNIPRFIEWYRFLLVVFVIVSVILTIMLFISLNISLIYKVGFFKMIQNSFLMFISKLPYAALLLAGSILPMVISYMIPVGLVQYIAWLVYVGIGFGHSALFIVLCCLYIFDETVNKKQFPEAYRKGLFDESSLSYEDEGFSDGSED